VDDENIRVLVVDDQASILSLVERILQSEGYATLTASDGAEAIEVVAEKFPDLVLMDVHMPRLDGIQALKRLTRSHPTIPVIMMSGYGEVRPAVEALKLGARDYLTVPFDHEELLLQITRALRETRVEREMRRLQTILGNSAHLCELMGYSPQIRGICEQIDQVARTDFTVVLYGESGSGKELVARAIHRSSLRASGPFVPVDCGSIPENLIESELFGHERGAFTGAHQRKAGSFERASGGTLFLDEIGNLPKSMQSKLLRAIQERKIERIGGTGPINIDIRIIAAGNRRLEDLLAEGAFREDLYHRLNEFFIEIPPLRERREDLDYLAKRFIDATAKKVNKEIRGISDGALKVLDDYKWPGNVRELQNVIGRAVLLCDDGIVRPRDLTALDSVRHGASLSTFRFTADAENIPPLKEVIRQVVEEVERKVIKQVLERAGGNKSQAARMLQIDYKTLLSKVKKYRLNDPRKNGEA
jgi:DNA-binding NtrC family response regulator